ncbi:hypothetical protein V6N11_041039 [Hibiscus sabdariffa]|uniref:Uncharacterized protein n=1 Tax=Hibiscus sabdariffa TaxID=183260 RepID=A0ABR2RJA5_9ROSI
MLSASGVDILSSGMCHRSCCNGWTCEIQWVSSKLKSKSLIVNVLHLTVTGALVTRKVQQGRGRGLYSNFIVFLFILHKSSVCLSLAVANFAYQRQREGMLADWRMGLGNYGLGELVSWRGGCRSLKTKKISRVELRNASSQSTCKS